MLLLYEEKSVAVRETGFIIYPLTEAGAVGGDVFVTSLPYFPFSFPPLQNRITIYAECALTHNFP